MRYAIFFFLLQAATLFATNAANEECVIVSVENEGQYVTLSNGKTYDMSTRSRTKTSQWKVGEKVKVLQELKLENKEQKQTISAKETLK